jgi:CBS domain-containing protein
LSGSRLVLLGQYPPSVVLEPRQSLVEAMLALDQRGVRHGLVADEEGRLLGILSVRRVLGAIRRGYDEGGIYKRLSETRVEDIMWRNPPKVIIGEFGVEDVVYIMSRLNIGAVAVVDKDNRLLGVISEKHIAGIMALSDIHVAVHEVMTRPVHTLGPAARIIDAIRVMDEYRHRHVPMVDEEGRLAAMITARDVLDYLALEENLAKLRRGDDSVVEEPASKIAVGEPACATPEEDIGRALRRMRKRGISALPVITPDKRVEGIISERDVVTKLPKLIGIEMFYDYARAKLYVARVVS